MKKYIKPEIVVIQLSEDITFCAASPSLEYTNPGNDNAFDTGRAKVNNPSSSIWGDDED